MSFLPKSFLNDFFLYLLIALCLIIHSIGAYANPIKNVGVVTFCSDQGLQPNIYEARILQKLVPQFASENQCQIGGCLVKWDDHGTTKFSLAWKSACGYGGIGDEGRGSTFVCEDNLQDNTTCCSPLGFPETICMMK